MGETKSKGTMFFDPDILESYKLAKWYSGKEGRVATMLDVIPAKVSADSQDLIWRRYVITTSGEFYGKSGGGVPIVIIGHGIEEILDNEEIMTRSANNRMSRNIQLTPREFHDFENGKYGPVEVLEHSEVVSMREYPTSVLSYDEAFMCDPLLRARLGPSASNFLHRSFAITQEELETECVVTNGHRYPYVQDRDENTGGLITISQLRKSLHGHSEKQSVLYGTSHESVISEIDIADLSSAGRFIAIDGKGKLGAVNLGLEGIFSDFSNNWKKFLVPNTCGDIPELHTLKWKGDKLFTQYRDPDDVMDSGCPQFLVRRAHRIGSHKIFETEILGYHGLFKYHLEDVKAMAPKDANAYLMSEPDIVWENGDPIKHTSVIQFFKADVDTSKKILREKEVVKDRDLLKSLLESA